MPTSTTISNPGSVAELLTDEKLPLKNRSLHLSAELREEYLLACLFDKHSNQYIGWASYPVKGKENTLEKVLEEPIFNSSATVSIAFAPNSSLLVPALYFKKEAAIDYLKQQQLDKANETPSYDYIKNLDSYNIYTINAKTLATLRDKFPSAIVRHQSSIFVEYLITENKNSQEDKVSVCVFNTYMDVVVLQGSKLILANRYYYENNSDFMYNLLWVFEQLKLNAEKTLCTFYGEIEKSSEIYSLSAKYIKKIKLGDKNEQASYSIPLNTLSPHKYRSLFTQFLCV
jgi:hypothetical protein